MALTVFVADWIPHLGVHASSLHSFILITADVRSTRTVNVLVEFRALIPHTGSNNTEMAFA